MWIYSLGVTLQKTISTIFNQNGMATTPTTPPATQNMNGNDLLTSLDRVILAMCEANLYNRASLMFLLDVSTLILKMFISLIKFKTDFQKNSYNSLLFLVPC